MSNKEPKSQSEIVTTKRSEREPSRGSALLKFGGTLAIVASLAPSVGFEQASGAEATRTTEVPAVAEYTMQTDVVTPAVDPHTEIVTDSTRGNLDYRGDFRTKAEDAIAAEQQIAELATQNPDFFEGISTADAVRVYGDASAENSKAPKAGLQTESADNAGLALERAAKANSAVISQVEAATGVDISDKVTVSIDQNLLTDDEMTLVEAVTEAQGLDAVIGAYNNDPTSVTQDQRAVLDVLLAQNRGFRVETDHVITVPGSPAVTVTRCVAVSQAGTKIIETRSDDPGVERVVQSIWNEGYMPETPKIENPPREIPGGKRDDLYKSKKEYPGAKNPPERRRAPNVLNGRMY